MSDEPLAPQPITVEIGSESFKCAPIGAVDRAALRYWIRERRIEAIKKTCREYNVELFSRTLALAASSPVYDAELYEVMASEEGSYYLVWRGINRYHPEVTLDGLHEKIDSAGLSQIIQKQLRASGYGGHDEESIQEPHLKFPAYDDAGERAMIVRYYGISLFEADALAPVQVQRLLSMISDVRKRLGEMP